MPFFPHHQRNSLTFHSGNPALTHLSLAKPPITTAVLTPLQQKQHITHNTNDSTVTVTVHSHIKTVSLRHLNIFVSLYLQL